MSPIPAFLPGFGAGSILLTSKPFLSSRRLRAPSRTPPLAHRPVLLMARSGFDYREAESKSAAAAEEAFNPTPATSGQTFDSGRASSISRQLEFWFSPSNLKRDWFLRRQMDPDGWLDPSLFLKFSKLKTLNVSLPELIAACGQSDALEISAPPTDGSGFGDNLGQTRVRSARRASEREADLDAESERSIVVTGFDDSLVVDDLRTLFSAYGEVNYSHLAKNVPDHAPAHAIVSYGSTEAAMDAVRRFTAGKPDGAPEEMVIVSKVLWDAQFGRRKSRSVVLELAGLASDLEWREVWDDITRCFRSMDIQIVYFLFKNGESVCHVTVSDQEVADIVLEDLCDDGVMSVCGSSVVVRPLVDEGELDDYWQTASMQILERKRRKENYAMAKGTDSSGPNSRGQDNYNPVGVIVYVEGLGGDVGWQDLMSALRKLGNVVFLNYRNGSEDCHVRFIDADTAAHVVDQLSGDDPVMLADAVVTASVLEGDEEEEYWRRAAAERKRRKTKRAGYASTRQD